MGRAGCKRAGDNGTFRWNGNELQISGLGDVSQWTRVDWTAIRLTGYDEMGEMG